MKTGEKPIASKPIYLSIEDEDGFEEGLPDAIVPVVFSKSKRRLEGECYFGAYPVLRAFLLRHRSDPFSKKALTELNEALLPYLSEIGYTRCGGLLRYYRSFVLWDVKKLKSGGILPSSLVLTPETLKRARFNRTDFDLNELLEKKLQTVFTLEDGEVVSVASVNEHSPRRRLLEVTVYTRPEARRKGYGRSNTALLSKLLLEDKKGVVYVCSCRNRASLRLAKTLGFEGDSCFYAVDAYKL